MIKRPRDRQDHRLRAYPALRPRRNLPTHPRRRTPRKLQPRHRSPDPNRSPSQDPRANQSLPPEDVIPVPCHPDSLTMAYALKLNGKVVPLTSMIPPEVLINGAANTILYEQDPQSAPTSSNSSPPTTPPAAAPAPSANYSAASPKSWSPTTSPTKTSSASSLCNS